MSRATSFIPLIVAWFTLTAVMAEDDHAFYRPSGSEVSGVPGNTATYHRSPCPALNALANYGHIPRDGKGLTKSMLLDAIMEHYNVELSYGLVFVAHIPTELTLADLGKHELIIEHDASLSRDDAYLGTDPMTVNTTVVDKLLSYADKDGMITIESLKQYRLDRENECQAGNPGYNLDVLHQLMSGVEAASLPLIFGDGTRVSTERVRQFLVDERFPDGWTKAEDAATLLNAVSIGVNIEFVSKWSRYSVMEMLGLSS